MIDKTTTPSLNLPVVRFAFCARLPDHAALGEFEIRSGHFQGARNHFATALSLARNAMERSFFEQRIGACK